MRKIIAEFRGFHKGYFNLFTHIAGFPIVFIGFFQVNLFYILLGLLIPEISHLYHNFFGKIKYSKSVLYVQLVILLGSVFIYIVLNKFSNADAKNISPPIIKKEKTWQTIDVEIAKDFSSLKIPAKVKSNQFAIIAPRRSGIVQDLLVDIGDKVYKGQTIGSMLPEGVEGQSSAAINEASARLQKARAELSNLEGVAIDAVSVATKQWRESNLQTKTQSNLDEETQKQLAEKKREAVLVNTQAWENTKLLLFGSESNSTSRKVVGNFADSSQENIVENLADQIQKMEKSEQWNNSENVLEHLSHLENFLSEAEKLYKTAREDSSTSNEKIANNLTKIQSQQLRISNIKQSVLSLEEKSKRFSSVQAEKEAGEARSREVLDLVQSQQNLTTTQAEKNVQVSLANYNAALVKAGHQSITSPFEGIITARMVEVGQAVNANTELFYLEGAKTARSQEALSEIHFNFPESWKNKISVGDAITIKTINGEKFSGKILRLSQHINLKTNSISGTAMAFEKTYEKISLEMETEEKNEEIEIINPMNFAHGQSIFVYVTAPDSQIFTVPTLALKKRSNEYFLWKMEEETPVQIQVQLMAEDGEFSQVFSREIKPDDFVISNPSVSLFKK